jgi:hypothetical protein
VDAVWFLVVALGLICVGTVVVALRYREPRREDAGIDAFQKEMRALSPESRRATDHRLRPLPRNRASSGE